MRYRYLLLLLLALLGGAAVAADAPYQPTWDSLKAHRDPDWFRDAKFGIYCHWGPVTVGSSATGGEWYGREMYETGSAPFKWHLANFGDQHTVGYKDVIPKFTAEKFDAAAWADLFVRAGARFAGPVAVHHDNFANWDSAVTRWNSMKMGPHRDIVGELSKAIRARGLRFLTTFHHGFAWRYYEPAYAYDAGDAQYADLYGEPHAAGAPPSKLFQDRWLSMVDEVVNKYEPDMIWFDFELGTVITPEYRQRMFADYYNWAAAHDKQVCVAHKHGDIHQYTGVLDFERGREDRLTPYPWLTDTAVGPWFNVDAAAFKTPAQLITVLVDIVSKNGCMLLNAGPRVDGTFPPKAVELLESIGAWLRVNGEAIHDTRPWTVYGEGPTRGKRGGFSENSDRDFTAEDIRFTTKGEVIYATALGVPADGKLVIRSLAQPTAEPHGTVDSVELLGAEGRLAFTRDADALTVTLPAKLPSQHAVALRIRGTGLRAVPVVYFVPAVKPGADGVVALAADTAETHGEQVRCEGQAGNTYIAAWDKPGDWVSWVVEVPAAGRYRASLTGTAAYVATDFVLAAGDRQLPGKMPKTPGWFDYVTLDLGLLDLPAGRVELSVKPGDAKAWRAMNVRAVKLSPAP